MNKNQYPSSVDGAPWWGPTKLLSLSLSHTHTHTIVYEILIQIRICFSVAVQTVLKDSTLEYACFFSSSEFTFFVCYLALFMHMIVSTVKIQPNLSLFQYVVTVLHNFIHIGRYILSAMLCWSYLLRISINLSTCVCYQRPAANLLHKSISEF